ncbi:heterodisulfide reductase-related iron-sulfur binding cluster [Candidatus Hakubella thermalkaliphila]|uniref:Glycerol-3-phosphate dehydrogenase subunit C n=3 Tax=Candidatus Hakubella thermalkaliphila TaxID=2754717 RepID=A0A6V8P3B2_9ACTN|nr:heterodisulfide reductase-related iron-sulfur binding cluster [Candidatus Hakubella thermalkaliphila]GFP25073.1 glycerol-3-phosphate dehydrogenase subunit C [Candidatus Hakubella thermalkaliphila]GFP27052.1 glycerol-3-phosphate dehydrogenase subunit C [Candidatus Hakubella thermalkaliphila]
MARKVALARAIIPQTEKCIKCNNCMTICPLAAPTSWGTETFVQLTRFPHLLTYDPLFYCFYCQLCPDVCPMNIDVPRAVEEMKERFNREERGRLINFLLSQADLMTRMGSRTDPVSNILLRFPLARAFLEKTVGIDRRRDFPEFERQTFRQWFSRRSQEIAPASSGRIQISSTTEESSQAAQPREVTGQGVERPSAGATQPSREREDHDKAPPWAKKPFVGIANTQPAAPLPSKDLKVAYFVGCFADRCDPQLAQTLVKILEQNGIEVIVPEQKCCGLPQLAYGRTQDFHKNAGFNLKVLSQAVREGYQIVTACDSCALALKREYPHFLPTEEARVVAGRSFEICEYLLMLRYEGKLALDLKEVPLRVTHKTPCHAIAQGTQQAGLRLVDLVPGLTRVEIQDNCCGIGGTFGFKHESFDISMKIGERLFREIEKAEVDRVITTCPTCKLQIEQGTGIQTIHPLELLSTAYWVE